MLAYNPIMVICLAAEFLIKTGDSFAIHKHGNGILMNNLMVLGKKILENMDED